MKKLAFLLVAASVIFACYINATTSITAKNYPLSTAKTLTNAAADTAYFTAKGATDVITVQVNGTKTSGTVAGTINIAGSIDTGATYCTINTTNLTDGNTSFQYALSKNQSVLYRLIITTTGTQVSTYTPWVFWR